LIYFRDVGADQSIYTTEDTRLFFNSIFNNQKLVTGVSNTCTVSIITNEPTDTRYASFYLQGEHSTTEQYCAGSTTINFIPKINDALTYVNTSSVYAYTARVYNLSKDILGGNLSNDNIAMVAGNILDTYSTPKIRMKIKTRFLEGDLDLFSRVTINWNPDTRDGFMRYEVDSWDELRVERYTGEAVAGHITWTTKDFWVIGIQHDYVNQFSEYTLREV
jgi:hypothetical protein